LLSLGEGQSDRAVVAVSRGNHGLGVAYALSAVGGKGIVCVPEHASPVKVAAIRRYGVEVRVMGQEPAETERLARRLAAETEMSYISPYNDLDVIAGQGTVGEEIAQQLGGRAVDAVVVAVGGGGLISGIGAVIKSALPGVGSSVPAPQTTPPWPPRSGPARSCRSTPCRRSATERPAGRRRINHPAAAHRTRR
jgi:threonine dehydratase